MAEFGVNMMFFRCHRTVYRSKGPKIFHFSKFNKTKLLNTVHFSEVCVNRYGVSKNWRINYNRSGKLKMKRFSFLVAGVAGLLTAISANAGTLEDVRQKVLFSVA